MALRVGCAWWEKHIWKCAWPPITALKRFHRSSIISDFQVGLFRVNLMVSYRSARTNTSDRATWAEGAFAGQSEIHSLGRISRTRSFPEPWTKKSLRFPKARNSIFFWESFVSVPM